MRRIAIVDDDEPILDVLKLIIERIGYQVIPYKSADSLMQEGCDVDLYIIDLQLPGVNGYDLCKFLKSQTETGLVPVIMMSANPSIRQMAKEAGADDFIEKPFNTKILMGTIKKYV